MKKIIYVVLTLLAITAVALYAQQPKTAPAGHEHHAMNGAGEHHCSMMAANKEMSDKMGAMDAKLQSLVSSMNTARGDAKVEAMSAVINELVAQRSQMRTDMMSMHGEMAGCCIKGGDVAHASHGAKGMEGCPMHKGTK